MLPQVDVCSIGLKIIDPGTCSITEWTMDRWQNQLFPFSLQAHSLYFYFSDPG